MLKLTRALHVILVSFIFFVSTTELLAQCPGGTLSTNDIDIVFDPPPNPDGSFDAGTTVEICVTVTDWPEAGFNWMHGLEFNFHPAWDISSVVVINAPEECGDNGGVWYWESSHPDGYGPGFYFDVNVGGAQDGNPFNNFGDDCTALFWDFCIEITLGPPAGEAGYCGGPGSPFNNVDITPTLTAQGDGNTGSWTTAYTPPCQASEPVTLNCCDAEPGLSPGVLPLCDNGAICLFDELSGTPETGGTWQGPAGWMTDGTDCGNFDPASDPLGDYTYTVLGTGGCESSATITFELLDLGQISSVVHCDPGTYDLNAILVAEGLPTTGDWYEPGTFPDPLGIVAGGILDPNVSNPGSYVYAYYDSGNCLTTASVNVIFSTGSAGGCEIWVEVCTEDNTFCPFDLLDCNPAPGGSWIHYDEDGSFNNFYSTYDICLNPATFNDNFYLTYV